MYKSFSTVAMASLISATFASSLELTKRQTGQCASAHLMVAGGCALPCTTDGLSFLTTTVANITNEIPGSDLYLVPYDGSEKQAAVSGPLLNQAIAQYTQECPNTPIILVGYSLGGIIVTNSLCGQVPYNANIIASVTYGEETFAYPTSYDRGTCMANAPLYSRPNAAAACAPFAPIMRSYCDALDPNCCSTGNIDNNAAHFEYPGKYDLQVAAYVLSQYDAYVAAHGGAKSSSSASASKSSSSGAHAFSSMPIYGNSSIPAHPKTAASVVIAPSGTANSVVTETIVTKVPVSTMTANGGNSVVRSPVTRVITKTITVAGETTIIPLYEPTGLSTPVNPTGTAVPNSVAFESVGAPSGGAQIVPVGKGSGVAIPEKAPAPTGGAQSGPGAPVAPVPAGPPSAASTGGMYPTSGLTPFNPNGASSLAMPGSLIACALLAVGLLL